MYLMYTETFVKFLEVAHFKNKLMRLKVYFDMLLSTKFENELTRDIY